MIKLMLNSYRIRLANQKDIPAISELMDISIKELQKGYLSHDQIQASFGMMGLDTQLITDKTFYCVFYGQALVACGGWSRRATRYGGNHTAGRDASLLNPKTDRARIRAMYTHPNHAKKGIGKMILEASEIAAKFEGFKALEMVATMAGKPFYLRCGYHIESEWDDNSGQVPVPLCSMTKILA